MTLVKMRLEDKKINDTDEKKVKISKVNSIREL